MVTRAYKQTFFVGNQWLQLKVLFLYFLFASCYQFPFFVVAVMLLSISVSISHCLVAEKMKEKLLLPQMLAIYIYIFNDRDFLVLQSDKQTYMSQIIL